MDEIKEQKSDTGKGYGRIILDLEVTQELLRFIGGLEDMHKVELVDALTCKAYDTEEAE